MKKVSIIAVTVGIIFTFLLLHSVEKTNSNNLNISALSSSQDELSYKQDDSDAKQEELSSDIEDLSSRISNLEYNR